MISEPLVGCNCFSLGMVTDKGGRVAGVANKLEKCLDFESNQCMRMMLLAFGFSLW